MLNTIECLFSNVNDDITIPICKCPKPWIMQTDSTRYITYTQMWCYDCFSQAFHPMPNYTLYIVYLPSLNVPLLAPPLIIACSDYLAGIISSFLCFRYLSATLKHTENNFSFSLFKKKCFSQIELCRMWCCYRWFHYNYKVTLSESLLCIFSGGKCLTVKWRTDQPCCTSKLFHFFTVSFLCTICRWVYVKFNSHCFSLDK